MMMYIRRPTCYWMTSVTNSSTDDSSAAVDRLCQKSQQPHHYHTASNFNDILNAVPTASASAARRYQYYYRTLDHSSSNNSFRNSMIQQQCCNYRFFSVKAKKDKRTQRAKKRRAFFKEPRDNNTEAKPEMDLPTRIRKLLNRATRGARGAESKDDALQQFVQLYRSTELSRSEKNNVVLPHLAGNVQQVAYEDFFPRILSMANSSSSSSDNHYSTNTGSGFPWMMQLRTDILKLMRLQKQQLPKLNQGQYRKLEVLLGHVRYNMAEHILQSSSSSSAAASSSSQLNGNNNSNTTTSMLVAPLGYSCRPLPYHALSDAVVKAACYATGMPRSVWRAQRFGPTKRVYGWWLPKNTTTTSQPHQNEEEEAHHHQQQQQQQEQPAVMLYVSLQPTIPLSLNEIYAQKPKEQQLLVATFYAITNVAPGLSGLGLGEHLTHQVVQHLLSQQQQQQQEEQQQDEQQQRQNITASTITTFATLSPMHGFRQWMLRNGNESLVASLIMNKNDNNNNGTTTTPPSEDVMVLAKEWGCRPDQVPRRVKALLTRQYEAFRDVLAATKEPIATEAAVNNLLSRVAAYYIVDAKNQTGKPFDTVARAHIHNGASVYRINVAADLSEFGWMDSFGIMVNYHYDLTQLSRNQSKHKANPSTFQIHENVSNLLPPRQAPSKMGKPIKGDGYHHAWNRGLVRSNGATGPGGRGTPHSAKGSSSRPSAAGRTAGVRLNNAKNRPVVTGSSRPSRRNEIPGSSVSRRESSFPTNSVPPGRKKNRPKRREKVRAR